MSRWTPSAGSSNAGQPRDLARRRVQACSLARGRELARRVFARRGNRSEAHVSEAELAALLALAYELGLQAGEHS